MSFEESEGPDDTCDLRINAGGPYEVTIDGGPIMIFPNESVVPVPQGSSVHYLRQERTIGSTAIGINETCAAFVPEAGAESSSSEGGGVSIPLIAGAGTAIVILVLGAAWGLR